jgi:hypothetical protein
MTPAPDPAIAAPTDGLDSLARGARAAQIAAGGLRWIASVVVAFAALLLLSVALASVDRSGATGVSQPSASAYLDFDLAVLRVIADRNLGSGDPLRTLWAQRPPWTLSAPARADARLVSLPDAWAASVADRSRFRHAARGAFDALGLLLGGICLGLLAAAASGAVAERVRVGTPFGGVPVFVTALVVVVLPLWPLLDAALFYDRARSLGAALRAALFVAAFAGAMSGAAARALFAPSTQAAFLSSLHARPALLAAARLSALDATRWLVPLVPALAAAAVFACAKADQDPSVQGAASGLGALIRAAMREPSVGERLSSAALVGGALVVLWVVGHRLLAEIRGSLSAVGSAR